MEVGRLIESVPVKTTDPRRIAIEGTSTGGGMTLALVLRAKAEGLPLPGAIAPGSPWADLTGAGDSYKTNEWIDNVVVSYDGYLSRVARLSHAQFNVDPMAAVTKEAFGEITRFFDSHLVK